MKARCCSGSRSTLLVAVLVLAVAATGCGSDKVATSATPSSTAVAQPVEPSTVDDNAGVGAPVAGGSEAELATWQGLSLTDSTGKEFSVGELVGRPVFVENFATWCSNCRSQLKDTQKAAAAAGDTAVFLALSIEVDLDPSDLVKYADKNGFDDIRFAVMTPEFLAAMTDEFGMSSINAPSTPKIVVDAAGSAGKLVTGFESPEEIEAKITAAA